jgi:hypothetical protein
MLFVPMLDINVLVNYHATYNKYAEDERGLHYSIFRMAITVTVTVTVIVTVTCVSPEFHFVHCVIFGEKA